MSRTRAELAAWLGTPSDFASPPGDQMTAKVLAALRVPGTDVHEVVADRQGEGEDAAGFGLLLVAADRAE